MIETEPVQGDPCRFRTTYPVTLWPVEVASAALTKHPFAAPRTPYSHHAEAVLWIRLRCAGGLQFPQLAINSLRFFLKGQTQHVFQLYELLLNNAMGVALATSPDDPNPVLLDNELIRPVGFESDEGMLPYSARSFLGYRLLTEYFIFPEKFLFFELTGLDQERLRLMGDELNIFVYLNATSTDLEQNISEDTFRLGCTPVVNLYRQRAEPIELTHTSTEYRVAADFRRPRATEVYSVDRVSASLDNSQRVEYSPFFSVKHGAEARRQQAFWFATRRPSEQEGDHGTEVYLSLVDLNFQPSAPAGWTAELEITCLNRDLPGRLRFGGDQPHLQFSEGGAPVSRITCLTPPTQTRRPALKHGAFWCIISHLSLNHLSIVDDADGAPALREILKLYDFSNSSEMQSTIDGIVSVSSRRAVGRVQGQGLVGFSRGVEVTIQFDETRFVSGGLFLFACVLERFLGLYCSINSFSKLIATTKQRDGELRRWPPRAGERVLL